MAIFGKKKAETAEEAPKKATKAKAVKKVKTEDTNVPAVKAKKEVVETTGKGDYGYRITEKATRLSDKSVYVLNVPKTANKIALKKDLETKYKVTVLDINIVNSPKKKKFYKGRMGMRAGGKKAYITLKAGDSIVL